MTAGRKGPRLSRARRRCRLGERAAGSRGERRERGCADGKVQFRSSTKCAYAQRRRKYFSPRKYAFPRKCFLSASKRPLPDPDPLQPAAAGGSRGEFGPVFSRRSPPPSHAHFTSLETGIPKSTSLSHSASFSQIYNPADAPTVALGSTSAPACLRRRTLSTLSQPSRRALLQH